MERMIHYLISNHNCETTLLYFLKSMGFSHNNLNALKSMPSSILVNGSFSYMSTLLHLGDEVAIHISEVESSKNIVPIDLAFEIIYEDKDILVINKPANMPIHPSIHNYDNTLANAVIFYYQQQNIPYVFRCVNRLDRNTTGLTLLAKHMLSANILSDMMKKRIIHRRYLALVEGKTLSRDSIFAPIGRKEGSAIERNVDFSHGESAITHYELLSFDSIRNLSLISLQLETGRTHQIRVHMNHIGHPLIGDFLYHPNMEYITRQALHSHELRFLHPITKESMCFTAPLPEDMNLI